MGQSTSAVTEFGTPEPFETAALMLEKLRFHTDIWDLWVDLKKHCPDILTLDTRPKQSYTKGHIPGAISFPHREMNEESVAKLDRSKVYVVYCDGIGCNGSTKGCYKLARLGFRVKELIGGLDWWTRDGHPIATGEAPGSIE